MKARVLAAVPSSEREGRTLCTGLLAAEGAGGGRCAADDPLGCGVSSVMARLRHDSSGMEDAMSSSAHRNPMLSHCQTSKTDIFMTQHALHCWYDGVSQ